MFAEFRTFIARGNVMELAVAVIIGAAFATITSSLTDDIIMPVVGWIFGGVDFSSYFLRLGPVPDGYAGSLDNYAELKQAGVAMVGYGQFVTMLVNFVILAFIIFLLVRSANRISAEADEPAEEAAKGPTETELLSEIRDLLRRSSRG